MLEFKNLKDFMVRMSDEDACCEHMEEMRWGGKPFCPHCNSTKPYKLKDKKTYRCSNKSCRRDFTVTVGTVFENSKVKLSTWMAAIYLSTAHKKGVSSLQLSRDLGLTQKTAWFVLHRIRVLMNDTPNFMLTGIVEADETYAGGKVAKMNRKRRSRHKDEGTSNKTAIMGFVQRDGNARLQVIGDTNMKDLVKANVDPSATIITDSHLGYVGLSEDFKEHLSINHNIMQFKDGMAYTNTVEGFFAHLKRSYIGCYHYMSPKHLQRYCHETAYRYNTRRMSDKDRFNHTLQNVEGRLTYKSLTAKSNDGNANR